MSRASCCRGQARGVAVLLATACATWAASARAADTPLHERIDGLVEAAALGPTAPLCDDAEFLRRVYLDLSGTIPASDETREFLADGSAEKRRRLVGRLLDTPQFARQMAHFFDATWMERRPDKAVKTPEWQAWLYESFLANKPYDELVRELLSADGVAAEQRPAARFLLDRDCEPNLLTRDVGRLLFGKDLQCAQCHDHPLIDDYYQADYYGLLAFVGRTFLFTDKKTKTVYVGEKADGEVSYKSVFTGEGADRVMPRLPGGGEVTEPALAKDEQYVTPPENEQRPVPRFSRRLELARLATDGSNVAFNRNIVNRLWAYMMGRGLVHPVDFHHADNPPSHPELLAMLADEFRAMKYDVRAFLRELALSRTYQRSSIGPAPQQWKFGQAAAVQQAAATAVEQCRAALEVAGKQTDGTAQDVEDARMAIKAAESRLEQAARLVEFERLWKTDRAAARRVWDELVDLWTSRFEVAALRPLAPEQFVFSLMQATGTAEQQRQAATGQFHKSPPEAWTKARAEDRQAIQSQAIETAMYEKVRSTVGSFVDLYGSAPGQEFAATINQALFFSNGGVVAGWLKPGGNNLAARLQATSDAGLLAEELYLSVFCRFPTGDERAAVAAMLKGRDRERPAAIEEMLWGLLSSSEFRFNH